MEASGTTVTRLSRTFPFELLPWRWSSGRFWEWPRNSRKSVLRLVTSPDTRKKMVFEFRLYDGPRASQAYQRRYGYRGQWLIELLGSGFHPDRVPYHKYLPASILVPPPPTF